MSSDARGLLPEQFWGLDPLFRTHVKMYINDVRNLQPVSGREGIFQYGCHALSRVDIQGVVVRVEERSRFTAYTCQEVSRAVCHIGARPGCVNHISGCLVSSWDPMLCYNNNYCACNDEEESLPVELRTKLRDVLDIEERSSETYPHGTLLHVRGKPRIFREIIEISAGHCAKLSDPNKETERMLLLPSLYEQVYDQPVVLPKGIESSLCQSNLEDLCAVNELECALLNITRTMQMSSFSRTEIMDAEEIIDLMKNIKKESLLDQAIRNLLDMGHLFLKQQQTQDVVYYVTARSKDLDNAVKNTIKSWCDVHGDDNGCPASHIYTTLCNLSAFSNLPKKTIDICLDRLESQSDIISTAEKHYIVFCDT